MKNRVTQKLNQAKAKEPTPESPWEALLLSLAEKALKKHGSHPAILFNPESLQIGTFHSFCASLLRGWPVESGIPPGLDLLDDIDQEALLQRTVDQYVESILSKDVSSEERNAYINRLAAVNNYPDALSKQMKGLLGRRDRLKDFSLFTSERGTSQSFGFGSSGSPRKICGSVPPAIEWLLHAIQEGMERPPKSPERGGCTIWRNIS